MRPAGAVPHSGDPRPDGARAEAEERRALVALSMVPGVGTGRLHALLARFGTAAAVLDAPPRALAAVPGVGPQTAAAIAAFDGLDEAEAQLERAAQAGVTLVAAWDARYPEALRQIYDPPALLWMRGTLVPDDARALAVVGTRRATDYGRRAAYDLAEALARHGYSVVSGLAYGIDAAAHRGALDGGGRTLAVLGSGLDCVYPRRHAGLAREVAEQGAVLSEYPFGTAPDAPNFPRRNRVISGLCRGVVVVEAFEKGGALITARLAMEQNRDVFAVPSPIYSAAGQGANALLQDGAKLVRSVDDILEEYAHLAPAPGPPAAAPVPELSGVEQQLYDALDTEAVHIDVLCARTGLDAATALVSLLGLEFKGLVRQMAGKQFFRA